jgi:multiple sugar transport system substrate-binding protein
MVRLDKVTPPGAVSLNVEDLYDQFAAGRIAMIRGTSVRVPKMIGLLGADKVGFTGTPSDAGDTFSPSAVTGWYVGAWSKGKHVALAAKFVEAMSSPAADRIWSLEAGAVPIRKSTMKENAAWFAEPPHIYLSVAANLISGFSWLPPKNCSVYGWSEALNGAAQAILTGGVDPQAAMSRAAAQFDRQNHLP